MPKGRPARPIQLTKEQIASFRALANSSSAPHRIVTRARIVLLCVSGESNVSIAGRIGITERTVCKWRKRISENPCVDRLQDNERSGRPAQIDLSVRLHLIKLACNRPEGEKTPFREVWTGQSLADALAADTGIRLSRSEVRRILSNEGIRPHLVRQWLHSPDPQFQEKVERICSLYLEPPENAVVLCVDEKPMQVLSRKHPTRIGPRGIVRREYEYTRHGTQTLLGAFNVADGSVFGKVVAHRTGDAIVAFIDEVARLYSDKEIFVVWDNLNVHHDGPDKRWTTFNKRHNGRFHFVHTPLHASWANQVEIWFSILERRILKNGSFQTTGELVDAVLGFIGHWNKFESHPFRWKFRGKFEKPRLKMAA